MSSFRSIFRVFFGSRVLRFRSAQCAACWQCWTYRFCSACVQVSSILVRIAFSQCVKCAPIATDGVAWFVGHVHERCKSGWTDRDAVLGRSQMGPRNRVLAGVETLHRKRQFWGIVRPTERLWESVLRSFMQQKPVKVTAGLRQPAAMLQTGQCHITLSPVKNPSTAMRPFVKILWPLFFNARRYASAEYAVVVCLSVCPSVCLSVCPSVTSRRCTKTA